MSRKTDPFEEVLRRLDRVDRNSDTATALCPAHDDTSPSLSVSRGDTQPVVLHCHAGCTSEEIVSALGMEWSDVCEGDDPGDWGPFDDGVEEAAVYEYHDAAGGVAFEVVRFEPTDEHPAVGKEFLQRVPGKGWGVKKHGAEYLPYRFPAVLRAAERGQRVYFVEGEKDVHTLEEWGLTATCNPMGAGAWKGKYAAAFEGADVVILPDNDDEGRNHARTVATDLLDVAESVRILELPELPPKGDVSDWAAAGGTKDELHALAHETPPFEPSSNGQDNGHGGDASGGASGEADGPGAPVFWYLDSEEEKVKIGRADLLQFLQDRGFGKFYGESDLESMLVSVEDNVVRQTSTENIKDHVLSFVGGINDADGLPLENSDGTFRAHSGKSTDHVVDALLRGANIYFSKGLFEFLSPLDLDFHRDTAEKAHFYYENGFVEVTAEGYRLRPYSDLDGVIWADQVIGREFEDLRGANDHENWEWHRHLVNAAGQDSRRHNALCTALGYLQHGYKDPAVTKAIIFMDEKVTDVEEGRTGKSLTAKALQHTCPTLRIDGRNFSFDSRFAFQEAGLDTQIVDFNDIRKRFPFERLFSLITDDFPVERKGKDRVTIPFEDSPKFLLSTNYVVEGEGASFEDRTFQVEFSDYYKPDHSPEDEFGHRLFDDWGPEEWARFDNIMMACVRQYLRNGLANYEHVNVDFRRLKQQTCPDFAEWSVAFIEPEREYEKDALWRTFREEYEPDYEDLSKRQFDSWLKSFARTYAFDLSRSRKRDSGIRKRFVSFVPQK